MLDSPSLGLGIEADADRIASLRRYGIPDPTLSEAMDAIASLAASACGTALAAVDLVDFDSQTTIGATRPWPGQETSALDEAICLAVVRAGEAVVIPDLRLDARTSGLPYARDGRVKFYAGVPITAPDGQILGAVCVLDPQSRPGLSVPERAALESLANHAMAEMRLRDAARERHSSSLLRRELLDAAADYAIATVDRNGTVTSWNSGATNLLGWTEEEAVGGDALGLLGGPVPECGGADERWRTGKDGVEFWASGRAMPLPTSGGMAVILADRTVQRRDAEALDESARAVRSLLEVSPQVVWFGDAEGNVTYGNTYWFDYTGRDPTRASGTSWLEAVRPDLRERSAKVWREAVTSREPYSLETAFWSAAHGDFRWFLVKGRPVRGRDGAVGGWIGIAVEVHERKAAEERVKALNATLEAQVAERTLERDRLWRTSRDLLCSVAEGVIREVNPAWTTSLGWRADELAGKAVFDLVHPDDLKATREQSLRLLEGKAVVGFENRLARKGGGWAWLSWNAAASDGVSYASARDVTLDREAAARERELADDLRQAQKMEAVGQLTGGIAHDFNNVLAGIVGALDLLESRLASGRHAEAGKYLEGARAAAGKAANLTHRLLSFSRRQSPVPVATDAGMLVAGIADMVSRTVGPGVEMALSTDRDLWATSVDPGQMENAVLNLCINARDAMPSGGKVRISTSNAAGECRTDLGRGDYVRVAVTDDGEGMPPEVVARAFEPFYTTKPKGRGTGLGLSMVYRFAVQAGGMAYVDSAPGQGTTVSIYLPRVGGETRLVSAPSSVVPSPRGSGQRLLIVEDEPVFREMASDALRDAGYAVEVAADGAEATALLREAAYDLLVVDVGLPGTLDGRRVAAEARTSRPGTPVLYVTGYGEIEVGDGLGDQVMRKPFSLDAFVAKVGNMLAERADRQRTKTGS